MNSVKTGLTVYFEEPFWVGVFERVEGDRLSACKVTFGAEPKDCEVFELIIKEYNSLRFSPCVAADVQKNIKNPKRIQRQIHKQLEKRGVGTKSQQALKLQQEQAKEQRKAFSRDNKKAEKRQRFQLKQQKKKEKHRGR